MITLTKEQQKAHDSVIDWFSSNHEPNNKKFFVLGGLAGSGKTSIINIIANTIKEKTIFTNCNIAYVTYTGKASLVLKSKVTYVDNNDYIGTIHSLIYKPCYDDNGILTGWFQINDLDNFDLIVVDEGSMVDEKIWNDLLSYDIPILVVGDYGQLPPIGKKFSLMKNMDFKLTEIHRQALDSPIIKLALFVRKNGYIPNRVFGKSVAKFDYENKKARKILESQKFNDERTQILCGMNKTRVKLNKMVRKMNGIKELEPTIGEKIICLKNDRKSNVMNGQIGFLQDIKRVGNKLYEITVKFPGYDFNYYLLTHSESFGKVSYQTQMNETYGKKILNDYYGDHKRVNLFDFSYAVSVHKFQGSETDNVILIDERNSFQSDNDYMRWLYTGVTRASKSLLVVENYY